MCLLWKQDLASSIMTLFEESMQQVHREQCVEVILWCEVNMRYLKGSIYYRNLVNFAMS